MGKCYMIDVDGVIVDLCGAITPGWESDTYHLPNTDKLDDPRFWTDMPIFPSAVDAVRQLAKDNTILMVSKPWQGLPVGEWTQARHLHLSKIFRGYWRTNIHFIPIGARRALIAADVMVDDHAAHLKRWMRHTWRYSDAWLVDRKYNRHLQMRRLSDWTTWVAGR